MPLPQEDLAPPPDKLLNVRHLITLAVAVLCCRNIFRRILITRWLKNWTECELQKILITLFDDD